MSNDKHPLWASFLVKAAVDYFSQRGVKACLLLNNTVLQDGILEAMSANGSTEFILCIAPGFTTHLEFGEADMTVAVRFGHLYHTMVIPYEAITAVLASGSNSVLTDEGHINIISIPPVVYPPGAHCRRQALEASRPQVEPLEDVESQPQQMDLHLVSRTRGMGNY